MKIIYGFLFSFILSNSLSASDCLILLHGFSKDQSDMSFLAKKAKNYDYKIVNLSYPSTKFTIKKLAGITINKSLKECQKKRSLKNRKIDIIAHSMGGILVRQYLKKNKIKNLRRVVMLGPPNKGSEIVDVYKDLPIVSYFAGPAIIELSTSRKSSPKMIGAANFDLGIIAGNKTRYFFPFSYHLPRPNDGNVSVENTKVLGMKDHITLNENHRSMLESEVVAEQTFYFLKNGHFKK